MAILTSGSHLVVYLKSQDTSKVALMCGGGSGHEPAHAGFVGKLAASCFRIKFIYVAPTGQGMLMSMLQI